MIIQPYEETKRFASIGLIVSNRRVRYEVEGKACQSMSLTCISSIALAYSEESRFLHYTSLALFAAVLILTEQIRLPQDIGYAAAVIFLYFFVKYILSRKNNLVIYGNGQDRIMIQIDSRSYATAKQVLNYVEDLKLKLE